MIYNENLHRLTEVEIVKDFMHRRGFKVAPCDNDYGLILYRLPYVIEFKDALIENYLEVYFCDVDVSVYMQEGDIIWSSITLGKQNREELKNRNFYSHPHNSLFLSEGVQKMYCLYTTLEAVDKLFPLIEAKGGLASMRNGTFDPRFDFTLCVKPMWHGMKERYMRCIAESEDGK